MSAASVYYGIREVLDQHLDAQVDPSTRDRLALLVAGMIRAESASPARVAQALHELGLTKAKADSIERQIRRIENDPEVTAALCVHPLARQRLLFGRPPELLLIIDPTTQEDRVVLVPIAVWYRGRALPLVWAAWPANTPLRGQRFWARIQALLDTVAPLLPVGVPITILGDRAFGSPAFTDLVTAHGWHYVVRVQGQTRCRDIRGVERSCRGLIQRRGQRAKLRGAAFKKQGWRPTAIIVFWGRRHTSPLCLVSDRGAHWYVIALYRRRFPIEATFRDYKLYGWHWEQGQVTDAAHLERLLVGMALATWVALSVGSQVAAEHLAQPPTGRRRTVPWVGKRSLFTLGLYRLHEAMTGSASILWEWHLTEWDAPNWQTQIYFHYARAFVFAPRSASQDDEDS